MACSTPCESGVFCASGTGLNMTEDQLKYAVCRKINKAFMKCVGIYPMTERLSKATRSELHSMLAAKVLELSELADECMDLTAEILDEEIDFDYRIPEVKTNIYMMLDEHTGLIKIGRSKNPNTREQTLLSRSPSIILMWHTPAFPSEEKLLHKLYAKSRVRGEWFDLSESDVAYIKSLNWRK